jgi:pimeloyl-ACP methyl ester carboxylesterase/membrane protein DedA with SNARE-associated domain
MKPRRRTLLLAIYAVLVLASNLWIAFHPPPFFERGADLSAQTPRFLADGPSTGAPVTVAYNDSAPGSALPAVLLLHGSPGSASNFDRLEPLLRARYRVISVDLPGFGASSASVPDYSFRAHARYTLALMDALKLDRAHLVGFSMGGGVVLSMADIAPERVASIVMLSAIGAQEFELLGDYHLNHAVHGLQHGALWLLYHGIPHFGRLPNPLTFTRNFFDSDQRPLRPIMQRYNGPMLIFQGREDPLVPYEAAVEHARLVPQAELMLIDTSHFMVFQEPQSVADAFLPFFDKVEAGGAITRSAADPARIAAAAKPLDVTALPKVVGIALFATGLLLAVATFASEDLACISAGVLAAQGRIDLLTAIVACFAGIFIGDVLTMLAGRALGRPALTRAPLRWLINPAQVERSGRWFAKRETAAILISRFLPGTRVATYFAAGLFSKRPWKIALLLAIGAAIWTPLLVGAAYLLGGAFVERLFMGSVLWNLLLAAFGLYLALQTIRTLATHRGRREAVGFWKRWTQWEFWPLWVFTPPVIAYVLWLAIKHRGFAFTAANPAMPASGLVGESKIEILRGLNDVDGLVARYVFAPLSETPEARAAIVRDFMKREGLSYPIALKPDRGERGSGVTIARADADVLAHMRAATEDTIAQAYVPGHEFGVFYIRRPDQPRGRIYRITDKRMPVLTGDGARTLARLILDDSRAVAMAAHYIDVQGERADQIIPAGERVQLVELGTHSKGAIFLDGTHLVTPALEDAIDRISRRYEGFYFGRYDIRTPDIDAFQRGDGFKIIELNGVTSEATSMYDPRYTALDGWRTCFELWREAYAIGTQNLANGARPLGFGELLRLVRTRGRGPAATNAA